MHPLKGDRTRETWRNLWAGLERVATMNAASGRPPAASLSAATPPAAGSSAGTPTLMRVDFERYGGGEEQQQHVRVATPRALAWSYRGRKAAE